MARAGWPVLIGVSVTVIYLALLPYIERTWRATGDEPHYLLAAHSLISDFDFDLTNNYTQLDYLAFYFSKDITPQIRTTAAGQQILDHQLGLPVLIAPAYAWGGRFGVLLFQVIIAGLIAGIAFKLAVAVSQDEPAALLATLFVVLSPPFLLYPYLVYPELLGALLTTLVIYLVVTRRAPTLIDLALVLFSVIALPWLNRRFVPLAFLLVLMIGRAWRSKKQKVRLLDQTGLWVLGGVVFSTVTLIWFNNQFETPVRTDIIAPTAGSVLWRRLTRGVGWLLDQQRGLLIFAPIYVITLWGGPILLTQSWQRRNRNWFVVLPFLLSLAVTATSGGFWIAWEVGPRFLVVALPSLTPLLALAWRHTRRNKLWAALTLLLFLMSLLNALAIIQNPELPYKASLPLYYEQKSELPLTAWLPDLAGYAIIAAADAGPEALNVVRDEKKVVWFSEAGQAANLIQPTILSDLPFGHYQVTWPMRIDPNLPPETEVLRLSVKFLGGGSLFNQKFTAAELPRDGSLGRLRYAFLNTNVDRWRTPMILSAVTTGQSRIWAEAVRLSPQPFYAWWLPYLYLTLLVGGALFLWVRLRQRSEILPDRPAYNLPALPNLALGAISLMLLLTTAGYLIYQKNQSGYTYKANDLYHFVGQSVSDTAANDGRAWLVDPVVDPPQKAIYGPFDIYDSGLYRVTFRMKLPRPVETDQALARLQVNAASNFETLIVQPIHSEHFARPDIYHDFVLTVSNPRRQALSFEVHYTGVAPLVIDKVTIDKVEE